MNDYTKQTIDTYNKTANEYAENVKGLVPKIELEKFVRYVKPFGKILDIGCGSGVAAKNLQDKEFIVYGIDLSKKLLDFAKKESPDSTFMHMDMRELLFDDYSFDGIWQMASLLHLEKKDVPTALNEANRVLRSQGIIYIPVKMGNGEGLENDNRYGGLPKYYAYYKPQEIEKLLKDAEFDILENYYVKYDDSYRNAHPWINIFAIKK